MLTMECYHMALCINIGLICDRIVWLRYFGLIALVMHPGREIALNFISCYFTPLLDALLMLLIPNTTPNHPITYTYIIYIYIYTFHFGKIV